MKHKAIVIILIFSLTLSMTGCWNYSEIDQSAIVAGLAIDVGEHDYRFHVTAEIVGIGTGEEGVLPILIEVDADTMLEAMRNLIGLTGKKLFFGHCRVIILSEQIARKGIADILDFIVRDHEPRITMDVIVSKEKTAKELFECETVANSTISYEIDQGLLVSYKSLPKSTKIEAYQVINVLGTEGLSLALPSLEAVTNGGERVVKLSGLAVFEKDVFIGNLDSFDSRNYRHITDQMKGGTIVVRVKDEKVANLTTEIFESKTSIKPIIKDGEISFEIKVKTEVGIADVATQFECYNTSGREEVEILIENKLIREMEELIKKVQTELGVDIFGFGKALHQNKPKLWAKEKDNWPETFKTVKVKVLADVSIRSSGNANKAIRVVD